MEYTAIVVTKMIPQNMNLEEEDIELYIYHDNSSHCYIFKYYMAVRVRKYSIVVFICISLLMLIIM
jgi:hypothetical protein